MTKNCISAVLLELGPLVGMDGVLDGQLVQPENLGDVAPSHRVGSSGRPRRIRCPPPGPGRARRRGRCSRGPDGRDVGGAVDDRVVVLQSRRDRGRLPEAGSERRERGQRKASRASFGSPQIQRRAGSRADRHDTRGGWVRDGGRPGREADWGGAPEGTTGVGFGDMTRLRHPAKRDEHAQAASPTMLRIEVRSQDGGVGRTGTERCGGGSCGGRGAPRLIGQPHDPEAEGSVAEAEVTAAEISTDGAADGPAGPAVQLELAVLRRDGRHRRGRRHLRGDPSVPRGRAAFSSSSGWRCSSRSGMEPAVSWLVKHGSRAGSAVVAVLLVIVVAIGGFIAAAVPALVTQGEQLVKMRPIPAAGAGQNSFIGNLNEQVPPPGTSCVAAVRIELDDRPPACSAPARRSSGSRRHADRAGADRLLPGRHAPDQERCSTGWCRTPGGRGPS